MEKSHEGFISIFKEKDNYDKMKENVRSENEKQIMRLNSVNSKNQPLCNSCTNLKQKIREKTVRNY